MDEVREELLRGEDKLLKRILDTWERRYSNHLKDLTEKYGEAAAAEQEQEELDGGAEARDALRDAVDLKARVKAEFELLQQLRSEIEDSESAFDWKVRFERLEKENLHLREKVEDLKDQVSELERARRSKEFEIKNQQRYYDNRIEDLERQLRRTPTAAGPPPTSAPSTPNTPLSSFSTPTMQKVHQYTALTVISDDEDDFSSPPPPPPPPAAPTPPPHRSLPAIPLSASSPKPPPRREATVGVPREEHERVVSALATAQAEVDRLKAELETSRAAPELTASLERLREELCLEESHKAASRRHFPEELSFDTLSFNHGANNSSAAELQATLPPSDGAPVFDLETLAGVIVEASLHNAVSTLRQVEAAVGKERARAAELADSNRVAQEAAEALERRRQVRDKFHKCRQRLWQKVKKDATLRKDIEELESLIGSAGSESEDVSASDSLEEDEEERKAAKAASCQQCERLRSEVSEAAMARVGHLARIAELEEQMAEHRTEAGEQLKVHRAREAELESHIAKLRQLSVKDTQEIDSLISELDTARQRLASKEGEFHAQLAAAQREAVEAAEAARVEGSKALEELRQEKDQELQAVMKESFSAQSRVSEEVEEEKERLRAEHEKSLDMLDQKYQDEFVDLERHHTEEILALKKDMEERFKRERSRLSSEAQREVAALCEKLAEARAVAESLRQKAQLQEQSASASIRENEQFASQLVEQLIQYFSALEVNLAAVCEDRQIPGSPPKSDFTLNCAQQLQPALSESLEALSALVGRVLNALENAHMAGDAMAKRAEKLQSELQGARQEAEAEHADAEELREGLREQTQELHRAEALIRTYAEKESELTERLAELDEERTRIALELESSRSKLAAYREKEEAMNEEREQLASVRDILSSSMNDSSRALFEANQSLQDEKSHLESEFGRRFEALQAHRADLEAQVEALEAEAERKEDAHRAETEDLAAQLESLRKQMRADQRFLEEQTREREAERDHFQGELDCAAARVRDLQKENAALKEQVAVLGSSGSPLSSPGAPPSPPKAPLPPKEVTELRQRVADLETELEDVQSAADQFQEQVDELLAENARLTMEAAQRQNSEEEEEEDYRSGSADSLEPEVQQTRSRRQAANAPLKKKEEEEEEKEEDEKEKEEQQVDLQREEALRRSKEAEARLEEAEQELCRMRHVHEELQNDKEELQRQVCQQLSLLSALRQEVDAKRHIVPPSSSSAATAAQMEERVEELDAELTRVNEQLSASVHEVDSLRSEISRVTEEKTRLASESEGGGFSSLTEALLEEKNKEIDSLKAALSEAESREAALDAALRGKREEAARLGAGVTRLRAELLALAGEDEKTEEEEEKEEKEEKEEEEEEEEEEVEEEELELNIPASDEEGEATEVVFKVKRKQRKAAKRRRKEQQVVDTEELEEGDAEARLAEAMQLAAVLKMELERRQDEVSAMRVREETLDREVRSLLAYQAELQEDYDTVQNMLEESQQLKKEMEDLDPELLKEEFEEREAALLKELKEAKCLADEREEDLYVAKEEKEQLEANLAEALSQNSNQRDELSRKSDELSQLSAQLEAQGRELAASLERCAALHRQLELPHAPQASHEGHSDACDGATTLTEHDSGLSVSLALPATPQLAPAAAEREAKAEAEAEAAAEVEKWRNEAHKWRRTAEESAEREVDARRKLEQSAERLERERAVERSERERLQTEKDRLQRELDSALREVDCQRARLHMLLHGAEDELQEALSSLSPRSPEEEDSEAEEEELAALEHDAEENNALPSRVQALLDRIHKEGVQLLSLSELQFLQTHAAVIRHKLDAVRRRAGLKGRSPESAAPGGGDGASGEVMEELQSVWRQEKKALQAANESLKDLLTQMSQTSPPAPLNRNNNSLSHQQPHLPPNTASDWRQQMIDSVVRAYREERQALLAQMRSEVSASQAAREPQQLAPQVSAQMTPERRLRQLETRYQQSESQQRASLERLYQADRQSLLEETRSLRRRLHAAEQELKDFQTKQTVLSASELNHRHANTLRESEMAGQLEQLQLAFTSLHVDLEAANRRLGESEERALKLSSECQHAAMRATELEHELAEREGRMVSLADQLDREARRRQECMNLADDEKRMLDHLRSQLDAEKARANRLEADMKEERARALERAREAAALEQELRCQMEASLRRMTELEAAAESERHRAASLQRELDAERTLYRAHSEEAESRLSELSSALELERTRIADLRCQLDRDRRALRQARETAEEERAGRRQAAQVEAEAQAALASQLEQARARSAQLEAALEAERARLRKLSPRAEEVAAALERERAAGGRVREELERARNARAEAETRAERLQECLRGLAEEQEAERRRWREQERLLSCELHQLSSRLTCSAAIANDSSSRLSSALRPKADARGEIDGTALGLPSTGPEPAPSALSALLSSLLAAENQLDVLRSIEADSPEDLASLARQVRFVRQRLEAASGGRATQAPSGSTAIVRQNCELSRMVVRLAREKEELRATLCRLEEDVSQFRAASEQQQQPVANGHGWSTPCASDDSLITNRLYAKYLRSESKRRALVYQKRYLLLLLGGFRECEEAVLVAVASMSGRSPLCSTNGSLTASAASHRFRLSRGLMRFRAAVRVIVAVQRMGAMVQRWSALTGEAPINGEAAPSTPVGGGRRSQNGHHLNFLTPPTRDAAFGNGSSGSGGSAAGRLFGASHSGVVSPASWSCGSSPAPRPSSAHALSPLALGVRPLRGARSSPNEEFLHRLERLQRRMENYAAPRPARRSPKAAAAAALPFPFSSVR